MTNLLQVKKGGGPKPGLKKQRPVKPTRSGLQLRSLSDFPKSLKPTLTVIKVHHPTKAYRLIWQLFRGSFLCKENQIAYEKMHGEGGVLEAGEALATILGVRFKL